MYYKENELLLINFCFLCLYYWFESKEETLLIYERCLRSILNVTFVITSKRPLLPSISMDKNDPRDQVLQILKKQKELPVVKLMLTHKHFIRMTNVYIRDMEFDNKFTYRERQLIRYLLTSRLNT